MIERRLLLRTRLLSTGVVLWAIGLMANASCARAADRIDSAPFRLEVRGVPQLVDGFSDRPWVRQVVSSALFQRWQSSPAYRDAGKSFGRMQEAIGGSLVQQIAALSHEGLIVLMEPGEQGPPRLLLIGIARDEATIQKAISFWNRSERTAAIAHPAEGRTVWERKTAGGDQSVFYASAGTVWLIGSQLDVLEPLLVLGEKALRNRFQSTADTVEVPRVTVRITPAAWSPSLNVASLRESDDPANRWIAAQWDSLAMLRMELREVVAQDGDSRSPGLQMSVEGQWADGRTSQGWSDWVAAISGGRTETFDRVPAGTLVAMGGRLQPRLGFDLLPLPTDEPTRREFAKLRRIARGVLLGLDLYEEILARLPVHWGLFMLPRQPTPQDPLPLGAVLAWQMPTPAADEPEGGLVARAIMNALQTGLTLWAAAENEAQSRHVSEEAPADSAKRKGEEQQPGQVAVALSRSTAVAGNEVFRLDGLPYARPVFSLTSGYLVTATHPELLDAFAVASQTPIRLSNRLEMQLANPDLLREKQFVAHVAIANLRKWLVEHKPALSQVIAGWRKVPVDEVSRRLDRMGEVFEPLDDLVATVSWRKEGVVFDLYWLSGR